MGVSINLAARKARHRRVFAGAKTFARVIPNFFQGAAKDVELKAPARRVSNLSASARLFRSYSVAVLAVFVIGAVNPANAYSHNSFYAPELEGIQQYYYEDSLLLATEDGYIPKVTPQTEFSDRSTMNGRIIHEIESGETASTIAEEYGLKTNTVLWENGLSKTSTLKVGQKLLIPPVNGVTHVVEKGQDIKKVAAAYSVKADSILKQNRLADGEALKSGDALFIPGAQPLPVVLSRSNPSRITSSTRLGTNVGTSAVVSGAAIGAASAAAPATGKSMIWPTRGKVTQGYKPGHYAIDIAQVSKPPLFAAMDGTVVKASSGTWGGGYGTHMMIDHGNGLKTLYAHAEYLSVGVGDVVTQGQVIGKMGRTGNVRGRTGIHLHFEVIKNGVKKNPRAYF